MSKLQTNFFVFFIMIFSLSISAAKKEPAVEENAKSVRIAFFIDDHNEMFGKDKDKTISIEFARSLNQKTSHVTIVSNYVLKNMLLRKYTKNPDPFLAQLDLDLNDWDIYLVNNTQFFIFVTRDYNNSIFNFNAWSKIDLSSGDVYLGGEALSFPKISWDDTTPIEVKRLLTNKNLTYIPYAKDIGTYIVEFQIPAVHKKFDPVQLSLIFKKPTKKESYVYELDLLPPCNIFITGHGSYSLEKKDISIAGTSVDNMVNVLLFFNDKLNTKSVRINACDVGGKNLDLIQVKNDIPIRMKYLFIVDSITDAPTFSISLKLKGGFIDLNAYFEALDNFQQSHFLFTQKIEDVKEKYSEKIAMEMSESLKLEIKKNMRSEIKGLLKQNKGFKGILESMPFPGNWYLLPDGPNNFPQFWIPEIGWFQFFDVAPYVQKITDAGMFKTMARPIGKTVKLETKSGLTKDIQVLEKLNFDLHGSLALPQKLLLLIYSEIVFADLNIIPNYKLHTKDLYVSSVTRWLLNFYKYFPSIHCFETVYNENPVEKNIYVYPLFEILAIISSSSSLNLFIINLPSK